MHILWIYSIYNNIIVIFISIPSSIREGPRTTNTLVKKRYLIIYLLIMTLGAQPAIYWFWYYWDSFDYKVNIIFYVLFPVAFIINIIILFFSSLIFAKLFLIFANFLHEPREGIFDRVKQDKDYCFWNIRAVIKKWPIWIARQLSIPYLETLTLKFFGAKINGKVSLHEGWVDTEFIEIGKNVKLGQGSLIVSCFIIQNKLIIKKVVIEDNVIIGTHSVVLPGTRIKSNSVLDANSTTKFNQILKSNSVYRGVPSIKISEKPIIKNINQFKKLIFNDCYEIEDTSENLQEEVKQLTVPFYTYITSGWIITGFSFLIPGFLFFIYFYGILKPYLLINPFIIKSILNIDIILISISLPLVLISLYLIHLFFVAFITNIFYKYANRKGSYQGIFDRNLDINAKILFYYHFKSFLFKYPIFSFIRSPFPWLINWELRFLGSNKLGKGTTIEESFLHSNINLGDNCYLGTFTHLTNHVVDGVYGKDNLTIFGCSVGDNVSFETITGILPGSKVGSNSAFLPIACTIKFDELKGDGIYSGLPIRRLNQKEIEEILGEDFNGK